MDDASKVHNECRHLNPNSQGRLDVKGSIRGEADDKTVLLIHSDTTDGSTAFVDSSPSGHTITAVDATHEDAQKKFGATSIYLDTGDNDFLNIDHHADFNFGTDDFTLDCWIRVAEDMPSHRGIMGMNNGDNSQMNLLQFSGTNKLRWQTHCGVDIVQSSATISNLTGWHHVAAVRSGNTGTLYLDGVAIGTDTFSASQVNVAEAVSGAEDNKFRIGCRNYTSTSSAPGENHCMVGYIDEVRVSKGVARWTSDFTPPARPYATVNDEYFADQDKIATLGFGTPLLREGALDGACYGFDGSSDYVKVEGVDPTAFTTITVSAWVKIAAKSTWGTIACQTDSNDKNEGWGLQFNDTHRQPYFLG